MLEIVDISFQNLGFLSNTQNSILDVTSTSRFTEYDTTSATGESRKDKSLMKRVFTEVTSNYHGIKQIDRAVIVQSSSISSSTSAVQGFFRQIQGMISKSSLETQLSLSKQVREELY